MDGLCLPLGLSILVGSTVVASLYIWKNRIRDDPETIKLRFVSSFLSCGIALLIVSSFVTKSHDEAFCDVLGVCPWKVDITKDVLMPLLITAFLFLGTLVVFKDTYTWDELIQVMREEIPHIVFVRNYIVAPVTEELLFRAVIFSLLREWRNSWTIILTSAVVFSLAHSHHYFLQKIQGHRAMSISAAIFQLGYTFLFGSYSGSFFYKTRSLATCITLHIFCNFMGAPDIDILTRRRRYLYPTICGLSIWLIIYPYYLMTM